MCNIASSATSFKNNTLENSVAVLTTMILWVTEITLKVSKNQGNLSGMDSLL